MPFSLQCTFLHLLQFNYFSQGYLRKLYTDLLIEITLMILLTVDFWQISQLNPTTVQKQEICQPFL